MINLIKDIINSNEKIKLFIIGNGNGLNKIKMMFSGELDIEFLGVMKNTRIFILQNIDIAFAMGTAALDSASLGVPTVLLNPSNKIKNRRVFG